MHLLAIAALGLFFAAVFGPQHWVRHVMKRHGVERPDFPGTGGEMAQHLVERFGLEGVRVTITRRGDHYDPRRRAVRLSRENYRGRSLTAVAAAAHEVGHAMQHAARERGLALCQVLSGVAAATDGVAAFFFVAAPVVGAAAHSPAALLLLLAVGVAFLGIRVLVHLVTLPVEFDASFGKALPVLEQGGYLSREDLSAVRSVLRAAALTYVARALAGLFDISRWIRMILWPC